MNEISNYSFLEKNRSNFQKCSKDANNNEFMNVPDFPCIDFDNATEDFVRSRNGSVNVSWSADSFVRKKTGEPVLIEFKNGKLRGKESAIHNVRDKMINSILILEAILKTDWQKLAKSMEFILVYNVDKNPFDPRESIHEHMFNKESGTQGVRFDLQRYCPVYYRQVRTITEEEFSKLVDDGEFSKE